MSLKRYIVSERDKQPEGEREWETGRAHVYSVNRKEDRKGRRHRRWTQTGSDILNSNSEKDSESQLWNDPCENIKCRK